MKPVPTAHANCAIGSLFVWFLWIIIIMCHAVMVRHLTSHQSHGSSLYLRLIERVRIYWWINGSATVFFPAELLHAVCHVDLEDRYRCVHKRWSHTEIFLIWHLATVVRQTVKEKQNYSAITWSPSAISSSYRDIHQAASDGPMVVTSEECFSVNLWV